MKHFTFIYFLFSLLLVHSVVGQAEDDWSKNPELANYLSLAAGATIHSCSSTDSTDGFVQHIIDPTKGPTGVWRTAYKHKLPQWLIIELPEERLLTTLAINAGYLHESTFEGVSARVLKIEFSVIGPTTGYNAVGRDYLHKNKNLQIFSLETAKAKWIKLTIEGNWDFPFFAELGRIYGYNDVVLNEFEMVLLNERTLTVSDIRFETNSARLRPESRPILETLANVLHHNPSWKMLIEGHTDKTGYESYNQTLSQLRANAVMDALIQVGIAKERLKAVGFGIEKLVAHGDTEDDHAQNRRVVFKLE